MIKDFDTIAAVATALGESGIAIIRISGNNALNLSLIHISEPTRPY